VIILSGVLVVVAIVLLIAGIVSGNSGTEVAGLDGLNLIYISIGVSIVSALFLLIGVILRRKELFGSPAGSTAGGAARASRSGRRGRAKAGTAAEKPAGAGEVPAGQASDKADTDTAELGAVLPPAGEVPADAVVYVVPGRRRYHLDSCRQLSGRDKEELTFEEAREEGFSPCTACMPDTALAARAAAGQTTDKAGDEPSAPEKIDTGPWQADLRSAVSRNPDEDRDSAYDPFGSNGSTDFGTPARRPSRDDEAADDMAVPGPPTEPISIAEERPAADAAGTSASSEEQAPPADEAADDAADDAADSSDSSDDGKPGNPSGGKSGKGNPGKAESKADAAEVPQQASTAEAAAAAADDGPQVRILSGTKRYHRPDCALIEDIGDDADDLESLTRAEAKARGCTPCLVCQPDKEPATRD
jgi:methylphosphotriester-DNA--protein-cysteine methyltransferase